MHVHVPQPGNQPLTPAIDDSRSGRNPNRPSRSDGRDALTVDDDGDIGTLPRVLDVDRRHVSDGEELESDRER